MDDAAKAAKRAERQVSVMFLISIVGTVLFFIGYFGVGQIGNGEAFSKIYLQNLLLGLGTALAMFGIGIGVGMAMRAERRAVRRAYRYNRRGYGGYGGYGASEHIRRGWIQPRRHSCGLAGVLLSPL